MINEELRYSILNIVKSDMKRKLRIMLWGMVIPRLLFNEAKKRAKVRK